MDRIKVAAVHRPGKARTGVTTYVEALKTAAADFADLNFMTKIPPSGYDLVHLIDIKPFNAKEVAAKKIPLIADLHDYYWSERNFIPGPDALARWFSQPGRNEHYLSILRASDAVIAHSNAVAKHVQGKKVFVVPIAINFDAFYAPPSPNREPLVLLVGRDAWRKGLGTLIDALKMISGEVPNLRVEVIGKEYLHTIFWAKLKSWNLDLKFVGELSRDELVKKYHQAMIIYLGSWMEGFGLSLLEGMAAGCVGVGSTAGGIPEVISDGATGVLFSPGDHLELSAKMRAVLETDELRTHFMEAGQKRVRELFTMDNMRESLRQAYQEVAKGGG